MTRGFLHLGASSIAEAVSGDDNDDDEDYEEEEDDEEEGLSGTLDSDEDFRSSTTKRQRASLGQEFAQQRKPNCGRRLPAPNQATSSARNISLLEGIPPQFSKEVIVESKTVCYCSNFELNINEWFNEYENIEIFKINMKKNLGR
jgi:hypothetical protein